MAYLEELFPEFRKGAKIRCKDWRKDEYIYYEDGKIYGEDHIKINYAFSNDLIFNEWEFYQDPEPDWDYIIKNKCLCWFWEEGEEEKKVAGLLANYDSSEVIFSRYRGKNTVTRYDHCRPVRRDEVTFYDELINDAESKA